MPLDAATFLRSLLCDAGLIALAATLIRDYYAIAAAA